jgi:hypothetical protein
MSLSREVEEALTATVGAGDVDAVKRGYRLTSAGQERAQQLFADQRALFTGAPAALLDEFDAVNVGFKATMTAWQLREGVANDHQDVNYDADVLSRLQRVHEEVDGWLAKLNPAAALAALFRARLRRALEQIEAGDRQWLLSPRVDSYHSVWFELHEYLIRLAGRSRADEAASGRAM